MFKPHLGFVLLFCKNPIYSSEFYSRYLGLKPVEQSPTFVLFVLDNGVKLGLWSRYTADPMVHEPAGSVELCFEAEDVDELYTVWGNQGLTILQKSTDMDFGRTFVGADPDGHRIRVFRSLQEG